MIWPFLYTYRALEYDDSRTIGIFGVVHLNWTLCYERNRQNCMMYSVFHFAAVAFPLHYPNPRRWQNRLVYLVCVVSLACDATKCKQNNKNSIRKCPLRHPLQQQQQQCNNKKSQLTVNIGPVHNALPIYLEYNKEAVAQKYTDVPFSTFEWLSACFATSLFHFFRRFFPLISLSRVCMNFFLFFFLLLLSLIFYNTLLCSVKFQLLTIDPLSSHTRRSIHMQSYFRFIENSFHLLYVLAICVAKNN